MSKLVFQGAYTLDVAERASDENWHLNITYWDNGGYFTADDIALGDVLIVDTGFFNPGTLSHYRIVDVHATNWDGSAELTVKHAPASKEEENVDIGWLVGGEGVMGRPSPKHHLLPIIDSDLQNIPESFNHASHNFNLQSILDRLGEGEGGESNIPENLGIVTHRLPLTSLGYAYLPNEPLGDFLFNTGMLHCTNSAIIDVDGLRISQRNGEPVVQVDPEDFATLGSFVRDITVSYLCDVSTSFKDIKHFITEPNLNYLTRPLRASLSIQDLDGFDSRTSLETVLGKTDLKGFTS